MKVNLCIALLLCVVLAGCGISKTRRFDEVQFQEKPTVAVLCKYQNLDEARSLKTKFAMAFASRGFQVVPFKPLKNTQDYVVVIDWGSSPDYLRAAFVDYRSREIVGLMSYSFYSTATSSVIQNLVNDMFESSVVQPGYSVEVE